MYMVGITTWTASSSESTAKEKHAKKDHTSLKFLFSERCGCVVLRDLSGIHFFSPERGSSLLLRAVSMSSCLFKFILTDYYVGIAALATGHEAMPSG